MDLLFSGSGTGIDRGVGAHGGEGAGTGSWGASGEIATGGRRGETSTFGGLGGSSSINRRGVLMTREDRALTTGIINCRMFFRKVVLLEATVGLSSRGPPVTVPGVGVVGEVPSGPARAASRSARWLGVRGGRPLFLEHVARTTGGDSSCSSGAGGGGGDGGVTEGGEGQSGDGDVEGDGRGGGTGGVRGGEGSFASSFSSAIIISSSVKALSSFFSPSSLSFSSSDFCSLLQQGPSPCPDSTLPWGASCQLSSC